MNSENKEFSKKNRGKFYTSNTCFEDHRIKGTAEAFSLLKIIITRCEYLRERDIFEYNAISPYFEECEEGVKCPEYIIEVTEEGGEVTSARAVKVDSISDVPGRLRNIQNNEKTPNS